MVGIKFFNVFGPNEYHKGDMRSLVAKAFEQVQKDGKLRLFKSYKPEYRDGEQQRDFLYVKDAVNVVYAFMKDPKYSGLYNLGSGKARSWNDLARALFTAMNRPVKIDYIAMPDSLRSKYQYHTQAEMEWRKRGPLLMSLEDGVKDYVRNYLSKENPYL